MEQMLLVLPRVALIVVSSVLREGSILNTNIGVINSFCSVGERVQHFGAGRSRAGLCLHAHSGRTGVYRVVEVRRLSALAGV